VSECKTCHALLLSYELQHHRCKPQWRAWTEDDGGVESGALTVRASDAEEAATEWAKRSDDDEEIVSRWQDEGEETEVFVQPIEGGPVRKFYVHGEMVPTYHASKVKT
jgi:hypothetical protein